ncbi:solute carrier family 35 member G1-like [Apostichopus japonicus]|uniref:solute carrier family 35 member G1-like n=1 Tax=Stichopus japonicus TaxID=307972 RepID=UPI003AB4F8B2
MSESVKVEDESDDERRPLLTTLRSYCGLCYMCLVVITNVIADSISKKLLKANSVFLVAMMRALTMVLLIIPVLLFYSISLKDSLSEWKLLSLRGITSTISVLTRVSALYFSPLGDVTAVIAVTPILTAFWSWILLAETVSIYEIGFAVLSTIGICLIAQPQALPTIQSNSDIYYGIGLAVFSTVFASLGIVLNRKLSQRNVTISPFVQVFYYGAISTVFNFTALGSSIPILRSFSFPCWEEWLLLVATGLVNLLKQIFLTIALKEDKALYVSTFVYSTSIVLAYLVQFTLFNDAPTLLSILGALLTISSTIGFVFTRLRSND